MVVQEKVVILHSKQSVMKNYNQSNKRKEMISQGAYDGRFRQRTVKDKKKEQSKKWAREKK